MAPERAARAPAFRRPYKYGRTDRPFFSRLDSPADSPADSPDKETSSPPSKTKRSDSPAKRVAAGSYLI
jgi:hypothetical protein